MSGRPESERSDWTDLDLLTREEAHGRLQDEIAETEARLAVLGDADQAERDLLRARLRALREAAADLTGKPANRGGHGTRGGQGRPHHRGRDRRGPATRGSGMSDTIGFVGAGRIGEPMIERLLADGHRVRFYARRPDVRQRLAKAGAQPVDALSAVAACDAVVSCLYSDAQVLDVLPEVVAAMAPHTLLVSHTTGRPETLDRLAAYSPTGEAAIVDAAFSGTPETVRAGRLVVYLGGEPEHVASARHVALSGGTASRTSATGFSASSSRVAPPSVVSQATPSTVRRPSGTRRTLPGNSDPVAK